MKTNYVNGVDVVEQRFLAQIKAGTSSKVVDQYLKYVLDRNNDVIGRLKARIEKLEEWDANPEKHGTGYKPALEMYREFYIVMGGK